MRPTLTRILISVALAAGCGGAEHRGTVAVSSPPDLVAVAPGVQVIADHEEPVFYSNGSYWWFFGGSWYRSATYTGGWTRVPTPPVALAQIRDPDRYRYYRPSGYVARRPERRVPRPDERDPRSYRYREYH